VAVAQLCIDGREIALDELRLAQGWHEADAALRWTNGKAQLPPGQQVVVSLCDAQVGIYWASEETPESLRGLG